MANKHVTQPCSYTGTVEESAHPFWTYPDSNKMTTLCPECNNVVAINKTSRKLRKHNGRVPGEIQAIHNELHLIHSFEE